VSRKITGIAGSTSAITLSSAADSVPNEDTTARRSRPTALSAAAITSAGEALRRARSRSSAAGNARADRSVTT
jgi:hypothetical protein